MTSCYTPTTTNLKCGCNVVVSEDHRRADIELCPAHAAGPALLETLKRQHADPRAPTVIFPVRIDDSIRDAQGDWPAEVRESVHIGDFRAWQDEDAYQRVFSRLLQDLVH